MRMLHSIRNWTGLLALSCSLAACGASDEALPLPEVGIAVDENGMSAPSEATLRVNQSFATSLDLADDLDFQLARRGFIARDENLDVRAQDGRVIWRPSDYAFIDGAADASVNPSLWRQAALNNIHGLFEVQPGLYQVRGYDLANMSIIEGETGRIIIDPLTSVETAGAAMALVNRELGERPIAAIILTHSHIDHFGGIGGIVDLETFADSGIPLIAPAGFTQEAVSENVMAGVVMGRRAGFMYGGALPRTPRGHIGSGLGKHPAFGSYTIAAPNVWINETGQSLTIDGVDMVFQYAPQTEAPAELTIHFPQLNAWCGAEIVSRTMHNLYTLRGAQVRDALAWSAAIDEARVLFGGETNVIFNSHHWPVWGAEEADVYLQAHRDIYKYIHDQTLRLAASGLGPDEIAEAIALPPELERVFAIRGYYGTLKHNSRAVYQRYFGWFDAVPAHLDPLPRTQAATRYVEALGGLDEIIAQAETAYSAGDYRWSAELAQHAVFAEPSSDAARHVLARSYEQMGYQAEAAPWRDVYLTGAWELRNGIQPLDVDLATEGIIASIPLDMFFSAMATRLNGPDAAGRNLRFNFIFTDVDESFVVEVSNGVMRHRAGRADENVDASVRLTREFWMRMIAQEAGLVDMITSADFAIEGDRGALLGFFALLEQPETDFAIVTP
jgi:alkyl sulfatase BDS1-like metallo-beta-lactamase superfamily hydrolase